MIFFGKNQIGTSSYTESGIHLAIILWHGLVSTLLWLLADAQSFSTGLSRPFSLEGLLISAGPLNGFLLSRLYLKSLASSSLLPLFRFNNSLLLRALWSLIYGVDMRFGVGPPLGRTFGLTLTTRATLSQAIRTALKKEKITVKMAYKLIYNFILLTYHQNKIYYTIYYLVDDCC